MIINNEVNNNTVVNYDIVIDPVVNYDIVICYSDSRNLWTVMGAGGLAP
jgi:hypothetical protein